MFKVSLKQQCLVKVCDLNKPFFNSLLIQLSKAFKLNTNKCNLSESKDLLLALVKVRAFASVKT